MRTLAHGWEAGLAIAVNELVPLAPVPRSTGISSAADVLTVGSLHAKLHAQIAGLGVGFVPRTLAADALAEGRLVELAVAAPKPPVQLSVAWRAETVEPATRWFAQRPGQIGVE